MYKNIIDYKFVNSFIENNFENKKEYYFIGFKSVEYYITKVIYNYLIVYNSEIEFCCNFDLVQKFVKTISSKEYFKRTFNLDEKYIYSFIGAVICDDSLKVEDVILTIYKIDEFLLSKFKKENNKFIFVKKYLDKFNYKIDTSYFVDNVNVSCSLNLNNMIFTSTAKTLLETKYNCLEEIAKYLVSSREYFDVKEVVNEYNIENAVEKLNSLYTNGYINEPNYIYITHDEYEEIKYEVRCSIVDISFYSVKIHSDKEVAKNQTAFSMLEMIVMQNT